MQMICQPFYGGTIGEFLKMQLADHKWEGLHWAVAFTKASGTKHVREGLADFSKRSSVRLSLGIDHKGTSYEGLFDLHTTIGPTGEIFIIHNKAHSTFHPKIYSFFNSTSATALIGSGNLTEGGLYSNYEAATILEYDLTEPKQADAFRDLSKILNDWSDLKSDTVNILSDGFLEDLKESGLIIVEEETLSSETNMKAAQAAEKDDNNEANFGYKAPPKAPAATSIVKRKKKSVKDGEKAAETKGGESAVGAKVDPKVLLIQIKPHHNGEIFLSKLAVNEDPIFFGYPFTGMTTPKKASGKPYPQRDPDPIVNIAVFGKNDDLILELNAYNLNTVYYSTKSEIRITASPLVEVVPEYSIMIMRKITGESPLDYYIEILTPDCPRYDQTLSLCDNKMPGGGKVPRRYGWSVTAKLL